MKEELEKAVKVNAVKVIVVKAASQDCKSDDASKYTQAAVNAANAMRAAGIIK